MKRTHGLSAPLIIVGMLGTLSAVVGCGAAPQASSSLDPAKRGEYLVKILACNDCHTPFKQGPNGPEPDLTRLLSGHPHDLHMPPAPSLEAPWVWAGSGTNTAYAGPWGVTFAINLTPDMSGLGVWTEDMFVKALRTGKHMGVRRPIMPPMPWPAYAHLTDDDLNALWAYLRSLPPIENAPPDYAPAQTMASR